MWGSEWEHFSEKGVKKTGTGNIENADNPRVFYQKLVEEKFWNKMAKKFYGTIAI